MRLNEIQHTIKSKIIDEELRKEKKILPNGDQYKHDLQILQ
jgi:hypothetical protein